MRLPISSSTRERVVRFVTEFFRPDDSRRAAFRPVPPTRRAARRRVAPSRSPRNRRSACGRLLPGPMRRSCSARHSALRDHEQASQLREACDHVVRQRVSPLPCACEVTTVVSSTNGITAMLTAATRTRRDDQLVALHRSRHRYRLRCVRGGLRPRAQRATLRVIGATSRPSFSNRLCRGGEMGLPLRECDCSAPARSTAVRERGGRTARVAAICRDIRALLRVGYAGRTR